MSTGVIVAIVVVVLIVIALLAFAVPRMRRACPHPGAGAQLQQRRQQAVSAHREEASASAQRAEAAEQRRESPSRRRPASGPRHSCTRSAPHNMSGVSPTTS